MAADDPHDSPIQIQPSGLLGFLQIKNRGRNPSVLLDSYQPTLEGFDILTHTNELESQPLAFAFTSDTPGVVDVFGAASDREYRFYTRICAAVSLGVGQQISFAIGIQGPPFAGGIGRYYQVTDYIDVAAGQSGTVHAENFWAWPGSRWVALTKSITRNALNIDMAFYRRYALLPV